MSTEPTPIVPTPPPAPPSPVPGDDVEARIEAARQEEKKKLYAQLEELRTRYEALLQQSSGKEQDFTRKIAELTSQMELLRKAQNGADPIDMMRQIAEETRKVVSAEKDASIAELRQRVDTMERDKARAELEAYRQSAINAANGRIIAAMVIGNTKEQIDASVVAAKAEYERIVAAAVTPGNLPPSQPPLPVPGSGNGNVPIVSTGRDPVAYAKNRSSVLADVRKRFG